MDGWIISIFVLVLSQIEKPFKETKLLCEIDDSITIGVLVYFNV